MKKFFLMLSVIALSTAVWAQSDVMTAILQHENTTYVFKGASALVEAHNAAVDGDVITLSDGTFAATNITKSVSIYGAGFEQHEETGTAITTINGNVYIGVADATLPDVKLEGVYFNAHVYAANTNTGSTTAQLKNFTMKKCRVQGGLNFNSNIENVNILQCCMWGGINGTTTVVANGLLVANCYLNGTVQKFSTESDVLLDHCILNRSYEGTMTSDALAYSSFTWTNSILMGIQNGNTTFPIGINCVVKNCVGRTWPTGMGNTYENVITADTRYIFADADNNANYTETRTFELKNPDAYVGTDGTTIGITGGLGWNKAPATPVVKSLDLEVTGTTLNVTYEVEAR